MHHYFRRGEVMEIEPVPWEALLTGARKSRKPLREFAKDNHPGRSAEELEQLMDSWLNDLATLRNAAGVPGKLRLRQGEWIEIPTAARIVLGVPWYWPLKPVEPGSRAVKETERQVREAEARVRKHFGVLPPYYIATQEG